VGLAVAEALTADSGVDVRLEWPNDLTVRDRKVGGILCERGHASGVVAGIGVNVFTPVGGFPRHLDQRAEALEVFSFKTLERIVLAGSILNRLQVRLASPSARLSPEELAAIGARDALRGRKVSSGQAGRGIARGIAPDGALLLERPDGTGVRVVAGSVRPA